MEEKKKDIDKTLSIISSIIFCYPHDDSTGITSLAHRLQTGTFKKEGRMTTSPVTAFSIAASAFDKDDTSELVRPFFFNDPFESVRSVFLVRDNAWTSSLSASIKERCGAFVLLFSAERLLVYNALFEEFVDNMLERIKKDGISISNIILTITKIDKITEVQRQEIDSFLQKLQKEKYSFISSIIYCSALTGKGCGKILQQLALRLAVSEHNYPKIWDDYKTKRFIELYNQDKEKSKFSNLFGSDMDDLITDGKLTSMKQVAEHMKNKLLPKRTRSAQILEKLKSKEQASEQPETKNIPQEARLVYNQIFNWLSENMPLVLGHLIMEYYGLSVKAPYYLISPMNPDSENSKSKEANTLNPR